MKILIFMFVFWVYITKKQNTKQQKSQSTGLWNIYGPSDPIGL